MGPPFVAIKNSSYSHHSIASSSSTSSVGNKWFWPASICGWWLAVLHLNYDVDGNNWDTISLPTCGSREFLRQVTRFIFIIQKRNCLIIIFVPLHLLLHHLGPPLGQWFDMWLYCIFRRSVSFWCCCALSLSHFRSETTNEWNGTWTPLICPGPNSILDKHHIVLLVGVTVTRVDHLHNFNLFQDQKTEQKETGIVDWVIYFPGLSPFSTSNWSGLRPTFSWLEGLNLGAKEERHGYSSRHHHHPLCHWL